MKTEIKCVSDHSFKTPFFFRFSIHSSNSHIDFLPILSSMHFLLFIISFIHILNDIFFVRTLVIEKLFNFNPTSFCDFFFYLCHHVFRKRFESAVVKMRCCLMLQSFRVDNFMRHKYALGQRGVASFPHNDLFLIRKD